MKQTFTEEQQQFAIYALDRPVWVSWDQIVSKFPQLDGNFLGEMYKPAFHFAEPPAFGSEKVNTAVNVTLRLHTGYQDTVMSRPLVESDYTAEGGVFRGIELALLAIGDFHAVSSYVQQSGMVGE